jgi:hypothetical protein
MVRAIDVVREEVARDRAVFDPLVSGLVLLIAPALLAFSAPPPVR